MMTRVLTTGSALALAVAALTTGCVKPPSTVDAGRLSHRTINDARHVEGCLNPSICGDNLEPPLGGNHCPSWLACRVYQTAQNRCEYLHNLEHGHAVLAYRCDEPQGCPDVASALEAIWAAQPSPKRVLVTPDPLLESRVAALVWEWGYASDTVDEGAIAEVLAKQDADAPEAGLPCPQ